jgi:hypothetical protein
VCCAAENLPSPTPQPPSRSLAPLTQCRSVVGPLVKAVCRLPQAACQQVCCLLKLGSHGVHRPAGQARPG